MTLEVYGGLYDDELEELTDRLEALAEPSRGAEGPQTGTGEVIELPRSREKPR